MMYYVKDSRLYSSDTVLFDNTYAEISEQEYLQRMEVAVCNRQRGSLVEPRESVSIE